MDSNKESERLFSLRLSRVMGDIGVNSWMINRRRRTHLKRETMGNVRYLLGDINHTVYIFGSQTEATTTAGMKSDTDFLRCENCVCVALERRYWQHGKPNLLVLKNELTPPQHCYLQRLRRDCPLPSEQLEGPDDVQDVEGRIIVSNTRVEGQALVQQHSESGEIFRHGPSITHDERLDYVFAYHCDQLPEECQFMFNRPRPGHWPRPDTLARARQTGVFLVPQGYTESPSKQTMCRSTAFMIPSKLTSYPYSKWQWRFSTSLMERFLIFDFSPVQVKVYTLTKIIRKTFFKPVFGDRFSTFHIKTAMMFTIENYPLDIWREDNIVQCVSLLLASMKRWLKQKYCPHFTISGVNLFIGKLNNWELSKLCSIISIIINTEMQCLFYTRMDNINLRLLQYSGHQYIPCQNLCTKAQTYGNILEDLIYREIYQLENILDLLITDKSVDDIVSHLFILQSMSDSQSDISLEVVSLLTPFLHNTLASMLASRCIYLGQPITQDIFNQYHLSLDSDLMSSRLKFASMLYCRGQYEEAAEELTYCEGLLGPEVWQYCTHRGRKRLIPSTEFKTKLVFCPPNEMHKKYTMVCITFTKEEINCIPQHLTYEMLRSSENEYRLRLYMWKNNVVIDCIPFLYYLQHLTYRELHQPLRAQTALLHLHEYTMVTESGHIDTAFNMLGHCFELQNRLDQAWMCYGRSLDIYDRDNVSLLHLARLFHQVFM